MTSDPFAAEAQRGSTSGTVAVEYLIAELRTLGGALQNVLASPPEHIKPQIRTIYVRLNDLRRELAGEE